MDHFSNLIEDCSFSREWKIHCREMNRNIKRGMNQHHNYLIYHLQNIGIKKPEKYLNLR